MLRFRDFPIKRKLIIIVVLTCVLVIFAASAVFILHDFYSFRRSLIHNISTLAEVTAINNTAALTFQDPKTSDEILTALSVEPYVRGACIYTEGGEVFSAYLGSDQIDLWWSEGKMESPPSFSYAKNILESSPEGCLFLKQCLDLVRPITIDTKRLGYVFIRADLAGLYANLRWFFAMVCGVLLGSICLAYFMSTKFQRVISNPISKLAETMQIVSSQKKYSARAEKDSNDELGVLIEGFNDMLRQIEMRDDELKQHRDHLEEQVSLRTAEILKANRDLEDMVVELKKAKAETEEALKVKSEFLANVSHEIRTPMNAIIGMGDMMTYTQLDRKQQYYTNIIRSSARSLLQLINDILDLSKMESGKLRFDMILVSIGDIVEEISDMFLDKIREKEIELILDIDSDVPRQLYADPLRLRQVLVNLVSNAFKFTESGEITIEVRMHTQKGHTVELLFTVRDTGIGLEPGKKDNIFDAFSQADGSTTRKYGGTGLGLYICKEIVKMMGGTIWVESTEGEGSAFYFTAKFKCVQDQEEKKTVPPPDLQDLHVLVVDDSLVTQKIIKRMLVSLGFRTGMADTAESALTLYEESMNNDPFDLILMDIMLPGMDGITAAERIMKDERLDPPPIIMISSSYQEENILRIKEIGIEKFMMKPLKKSALLDTIMELFGHRSVRPEGVFEGLFDLNEFADVKVLLVEDNPINQMVAMEILSVANISVTKAENGIEAIERVKEAAFDAVIMDIQMPKMDGLEATRVIRRKFDSEKLPIIAMTANAMKGDRERYMAVGMDDYVSKPIDSKELFSALRRNIPRLKNASTPQDEKTEGRETLPVSLPGIDIEAGLKRLGGNTTLFIKVLKDFYKKYAQGADDIKDALEKNNMPLALRLTHTIKGLAGNCSASELMNSAQKLESGIKEGKTAEYESLLKGFENELHQVMEAIKAMINKGNKGGGELPHQPKNVDPTNTTMDSDTRRLLMEMSEYLTKRKNVMAETCMPSVKEKLEIMGLHDDALHMAELIDQMDYKAALAHLQHVAEKAGASLDGGES